VTYTLDSNKVKAVVLLVESRNLIVCLPHGVFTSLWPVEFFDPLFGAISWENTISVTRVEHHSNVAGSFENSIDPLGCLWLEFPVLVNLTIAILPFHVVWFWVEYMKSLLSVLLVKPVA